jgi:hypothetical protein
MTKKQKLVILMGVAAMAFMLIIPPVRVMVSTQDSSGIAMHGVIRYQFLFTESIKPIYYFRLGQQILITLMITMGLYAIGGRAEKTGEKRARILGSMKERLQEEIEGHERIEVSLRQQNNELIALNKKLEIENRELNMVARQLLEIQAEIDKSCGRPEGIETQSGEKSSWENREGKEAEEDMDADTKNAEGSDDSGDRGFDKMRDRITGEIENLKDIIKGHD